MFATSRKTNKMVCKVGGSSDEQTSVAAQVSDALLFITMYMIGLPVDVHVKDGSVYTGTFYTASAEKNYAIVLKNAMMTQKGNREVNIENGSLVDTLVVEGEDIVQVVAKGVPISESGIFGAEATSGKHNQSNVDKQHANETRLVEDGLNVEQHNDEKKTEYQGPKIVYPHRFSSSDKTNYRAMPVGVPSHIPIPACSRFHDQIHQKQASEKSPYFNDAVDVSTDSSSSLHVNHSTSSRSAKDSRLNPQAKVFTPSPYWHVLVIPATPAEVPSIGYFVDPSLMATADATQPVYGVTGYTGNATQAVTYASPYHIEAPSAYVHQSSQNILGGQMGQPIYLPPLAHDAITASGLSQVSLSPILAHYQAHRHEHQNHFNQPRQT